MKLGYYPGCALKGSSVEYDMSIRAMFPALGADLVEIQDWNCCGATAAHNTNHDLAVSLSLRNLALAEAQGLADVLAPCAACSSRLLFAHKAATKDEAGRKKYEEIVGLPYRGGVKTLNLIEAVRLVGTDALKAKVANPLTGVRVACYYGCLLVRPPKLVEFDDAESPTSMDEIVAALGAEPVDWEFKTECCGSGFSISRTDVVARLTREILRDAKAAGAELIVTACPMCQSNLDLRQLAVQSTYAEEYNVPTLFLSELVGVAMGMSRRSLGLNKHFIYAPALKVKPVEEKGTGAKNAVAEAPAASDRK